MATALKKSKVSQEPAPSTATPSLKLAGAKRQAAPVASPARELQAALAQRLLEDQGPRADMLVGTVAGVIGGSLIMGLLIYAVAS